MSCNVGKHLGVSQNEVICITAYGEFFYRCYTLCINLFHESGLKMAAPIDIISVLLGRKSYGRNGYEPKLFLAENEQSPAGGP